MGKPILVNLKRRLRNSDRNLARLELQPTQACVNAKHSKYIMARQIRKKCRIEKTDKLAMNMLLKDNNKDPMEVKPYRPVCLLWVLGKLFEWLLLGRMRVDVLKPGNFSNWQYGFMQGRSTEDAIVCLRKIVHENRESKYILGFLFDITGAFDNVRWPLVLQGLKERRCPANVFEVLKSYFRDRHMESHGMEVMWLGGLPVAVPRVQCYGRVPGTLSLTNSLQLWRTNFVQVLWLTRMI